MIPETLNLRGNKLTSRSLKFLSNFLSHCSSLKTLSLEWNTINDKSALSEFLKQIRFSNLACLDFKSNKIQSDCGDLFVSFIYENQNLFNLDLCWNDLGNAFGIHVNEIISKTTTLRKLSLAGNGIDPETLDQIESKLVTNNLLNPQVHEKVQKEVHDNLGFSRKIEDQGFERSTRKQQVHAENELLFETSKINQNLYDALKTDIIKEKIQNNELTNKLSELMQHRSEDQTSRENAEMRSDKKKSVFHSRK